MKKIFIYSENLAEPLDEGIKRSAVYIIEALSQVASVAVGCGYGQTSQDSCFEVIPSNRLLISVKLRKALRDFNPDIILYIPRWCGTFSSFVRIRILNFFNQRSRSVMVILQPKRIGGLQRKILRYLKPYVVLTPSPDVMQQMREFGINVEFLPLFVDTNKFMPLEDSRRKKELRSKYGFPLEKIIVLHVGHINSGRNLEALIPLQKDENQVVVVESSSTSEVANRDEILKDELKKNGIIIVDHYVQHIEEIYQLADVYVFPTVFQGGCIGIPLSVLEARACGVPVVSTDFGGLRRVFGNNKRDLVFSDPADFSKEVNKFKNKDLHPRADDVVRINEAFKKALLRIIDLQ
jgi:glycosyltransferase involved in cell wall biosynthesis